jgi:hypothetical protein
LTAAGEQANGSQGRSGQPVRQGCRKAIANVAPPGAASAALTPARVLR